MTEISTFGTQTAKAPTGPSPAQKGFWEVLGELGEARGEYWEGRGGAWEALRELWEGRREARETLG